MKTIRQFIAFPFVILALSIAAVAVVVELIGCAVSFLCNLIEGPQ